MAKTRTTTEERTERKGSLEPFDENPEKTEALAPRAVGEPVPFEPGNVNESWALACKLATSDLVPSKLRRKPADVLVVLLCGRDLGLSASQALRGIDVVEGKPSLSAQLIVGICLSRPDVCEYFDLVEDTPTRVTYETKRVKSKRSVAMTVELSEFDHLRSKDNWKFNTRDMLRARCSSKLARAVHPDLVFNLYNKDEAEEIAATAAAEAEAADGRMSGSGGLRRAVGIDDEPGEPTIVEANVISSTPVVESSEPEPEDDDLPFSPEPKPEAEAAEPEDDESGVDYSGF